MCLVVRVDKYLLSAFTDIHYRSSSRQDSPFSHLFPQSSLPRDPTQYRKLFVSPIPAQVSDARLELHAMIMMLLYTQHALSDSLASI